MSNKNKDRGWTSQKFIELSRVLGEAYLPGLETGKCEKKENLLTMKNFLAARRAMNREKASGT